MRNFGCVEVETTYYMPDDYPICETEWVIPMSSNEMDTLKKRLLRKRFNKLSEDLYSKFYHRTGIIKPYKNVTVSFNDDWYSKRTLYNDDDMLKREFKAFELINEEHRPIDVLKYVMKRWKIVLEIMRK